MEAIRDNLNDVQEKFLSRREKGLFDRFSGWYRAVVEETNDPLQIRRARVRIPELHDSDVKVQDLPWAVPAPWAGGINAGSWAHPIIKDIVMVCFEKNHPYAPIYCAAGDPTRRRMYTMWSIYTKSPQAVDEKGDPADRGLPPKEFLEDYLPKDGRPMSMGFGDRYGSFLNFSAYGFAPKEHKVNPTSVGTDALAKKNYQVNKDQPKDNDPDLKYITLGTKYGHTALFGDQGYQWFNEFKGDFEEDKSFEEKRYQYLTKFFNEQAAKDRDQRRLEFRTRAGHKFEMRDVGWDKSRPGEYDKQETIGDSKDRDERWVKLRSKGGHLFQMLDKGFDPEKDIFYKRLNKTEFGIDPDKEEELGEDQRMIRLQTRHGNTLVLDDRGSDPISADTKETPHGNGVLLRTRKGWQIQMLDKGEIDHMLLVSPKDQTMEINDRFEYCMMATQQSDDIHTEFNPKSLRTRVRKSVYVQSSGQVHDPASNTYHMILDKKNCMVRLKTPTGAGIEMRDTEAPCGEWVETRDRENRAVWMSAKDQWLLIRGKKGAKYILLDDNDDVILIRNEEGKIQIRAKEKIEFKCDEGDICFEAPNGEIGFKTKRIAIQTENMQHVIDSVGIGTLGTCQAKTLLGYNPHIDVPLHKSGFGEGKPSGRGEKPCEVKDKIIVRKKPEDFDKERGCDKVKNEKGPVPTSVIISPPGGGSGGGLPSPPSPSSPPPASPTAPSDIPGANDPPLPDPPVDPIEDISPGGGGVLWYGTSDKFLTEIEEFGLLLSSFSNNLNLPPNTDATEVNLAKELEFAKGKLQAVQAQKRYGGKALILRIRNVPDPDRLVVIGGNGSEIAYKDNLPFPNNIEVFEVGEVEFTQPPLFPSVV